MTCGVLLGLGVLVWFPSSKGASIRSGPAFRGVDYTAWTKDGYRSTASDETLSQMKRDGVNTVGVNVWQFQKTVASTDIAPDYRSYSAGDESVEHVISQAHKLGMKVLLKPVVDAQDGIGRGKIPASNDWFASYREFIVHYARMAERLHVELFSVGCELSGNDQDEADWRRIVRAVRAVYRGKLTYAANFGEQQQIAWWDALDYIGIDYYYPLTGHPNPTIAELVSAQAGIANEIGRWRSAHYPVKQILFTEVGYCSYPGANEKPWVWRGTGIDLQEQADCYRSLLETYWNKPWWGGAFWWNWNTSPESGGVHDGSFTPQNKPAETVMKEFYTKG